MKEIIIPIGASLIVSAIGYMINAGKLNRWMNDRRIDNRKGKNPFECGVCGAPMKVMKRYTGEKAGEKLLVCSKYPECRKTEKLKGEF